MATKQAAIGVIGGTGLYEMEGLSNVQFIEMDTPFGKPSDAIVLGLLEGVSMAFLPRHGRGHRFNPSHIPARANIYALKTLGVERIISISAVGSLKEEFALLVDLLSLALTTERHEQPGQSRNPPYSLFSKGD